MSLAQPLLQEMTHEAAVTRKLLERVPAEKFSWKPHEKSMSLGRLASHVAEIPQWGVTTLTQDQFDMDTSNMQPYEAKNTEEMLTLFDDQVDQTKKALNDATDDTLIQNWKMTVDGNEMINMPRIAVLRAWVMNHMIHHRGQLSVYLRENDIPVPAIYGPSADEQS